MLPPSPQGTLGCWGLAHAVASGFWVSCEWSSLSKQETAPALELLAWVLAVPRGAVTLGMCVQNSMALAALADADCRMWLRKAGDFQAVPCIGACLGSVNSVRIEESLCLH